MLSVAAAWSGMCETMAKYQWKADINATKKGLIDEVDEALRIKCWK